ncbi:D(4) dopamine receptor [Sarcophilus harrisii]
MPDSQTIPPFPSLDCWKAGDAGEPGEGGAEKGRGRGGARELTACGAELSSAARTGDRLGAGGRTRGWGARPRSSAPGPPLSVPRAPQSELSLPECGAAPHLRLAGRGAVHGPEGDPSSAMPGNGSFPNASELAGSGRGGLGALEPHVGALVGGILLMVTVLAGNALVCVSVAAERALQTPTNFFIVSLAVADLLLALLVLPLFVYSEYQGGVWTLNPALCDALMTMDVMLCTASIFHLCAISVDRFIAVSVPLNYSRRQLGRRQLLLIGAVWGLAFAVAAPVLFGLNRAPDRDPAVCQLESRNYVVWSSVCSFFLPCPLMLVLYCAMFRRLRTWEEARRAKLRRSLGPGAARGPGRPPQPWPRRRFPGPDAEGPDVGGRDPEGPDPEGHSARGPIQTVSYPAGPRPQAPPPAGPPRKRAKITGRERKAMRVLPVVVGAFLVCWTPFFVVHVTRALCPACPLPRGLVSVVTWLGYVNSALNPIIYTVFNTEFRSFFRQVLGLLC